MVGRLYDQGNLGKLRDAAFSLFYMGINIGAFFAPSAAEAMNNYIMKGDGFSYSGKIPGLANEFIKNGAAIMANLFSEEIDMNLPDSAITYYPGFLDTDKADFYFEHLRKKIPWQQDDIKVFGKVYAQPRLTALFGNNGRPYSYSNITMQPHKFTRELLEIKKKIEAKSNVNFTTCLANLYRDGKDSNGWHADNEKRIGAEPSNRLGEFGPRALFSSQT
jgi:hypothetical protein